MRKLYLILVLLTISSVSCFAQEKSCLTDRSISTNLVSGEHQDKYERIIIPYLQFRFKEDLSDEVTRIERKLTYKELFRYENIDNKDLYYVHIEFVHKAEDKASDIKIYSISGQEILFWIDNDNIKDFNPFDEYIIEQTVEGAEKYEDNPLSQYIY